MDERKDEMRDYIYGWIRFEIDGWMREREREREREKR